MSLFKFLRRRWLVLVIKRDSRRTSALSNEAIERARLDLAARLHTKRPTT